MEWSLNGLAIVGGLFGLAGIVAAIIAYLKTNIDSNTIVIQKQNIEALQTQNEILKGERDDARAANLELHKDMAKLQGQYDTLRDIVTAALSDSPTPKGLKPHKRNRDK